MAADPSITRSARTNILAALLAILAAAALTAMFFVILCPAQVTFKVTDAWRRIDDQTKDDSPMSLYLSIFANTTSQRHTKLKFESIFIDLFNTTYHPPPGWPDDRRRINAHVDKIMPGGNLKYMPDGYLKYPCLTNVNASAAVPRRAFRDFEPNWFISVTLMAQVHFKAGVMRSRLYGIKVYCYRVEFHEQNKTSPYFPVACHT